MLCLLPLKKCLNGGGPRELGARTVLRSSVHAELSTQRREEFVERISLVSVTHTPMSVANTHLVLLGRVYRSLSSNQVL